MEYIYIYWNSHGTLPSANQTSAGKSRKLDFDEFPYKLCFMTFGQETPPAMGQLHRSVGEI